MNKLILQEDWYQQLVEECKSIITEAVFTSRWALVEGYWTLGQRIRLDKGLIKWSQNEAGQVLQGLAKDIGKSERTIYNALAVFDKFKTLDEIPEGKNISMNKLINLYLPQPKKEKIVLPKGKYRVIYADIPWKYDVDLSSGTTRSPENNYPVMDLDEIKAFGIEIEKIANKDCILFMWITAPKLNWMNDVLQAWGFDYKTNLIWDKIKPNMGHYSSVRHEILIIAGKGTCSPTCDGKTIQSVDSVQSIEKTNKHSEKPEEFRKIIEKLYPDSKKIELFARGKAPQGWVFWGNQANE